MPHCADYFVTLNILTEPYTSQKISEETLSFIWKLLKVGGIIINGVKNIEEA